MEADWTSKKDTFQEVDVRAMSGNFLPWLIKKATETAEGEGLCVIQSFEPIPLYSALADLGFEHVTEKISDTEYRVFFYRTEAKEGNLPGGIDLPFKPTAMLNFKKSTTSLRISSSSSGAISGRERTRSSIRRPASSCLSPTASARVAFGKPRGNLSKATHWA